MNSSSLKTPLTDLPLVIDTKKRRLRIYKQTLALLDNPEYIQLLVNPEKKMILLCPATSRQASCERIKWKQLNENQCCEIYSTSFVEKLMLLSNVWVKIVLTNSPVHFFQNKNLSCITWKMLYL